MTITTADIVVVGLGAAGSALTWQLARRGARVVGIDRHDPPHDQGSSHGHTRITRQAVGEGAAFVPLVLRSHALWHELEQITGERLMQATGVAIIGSPATAATAHHGQGGFLERTQRLASEFGIVHEVLDASALRDRFPAFQVQDDESAYYEPDSGVLFPERCVQAQLMLAERAGATVLRRCRMTRLEPIGSAVAVHTESGVLQAGRVVLCTGAWLPQQAGPPHAGRLRVLRQVLHWFDVDEPARYHGDVCPAYMWFFGAEASDSFYGFPRVDGRPGVKVATEQLEQSSDPDAVDRTVAPAESEGLYHRKLAGRLRGLRLPALQSVTCLYTMSPDGNFVVTRHPRLEGVTLVSPCSGHGFKHSAALGESLAQQLLGQVPTCALDAFDRAP